MIKKQKKLIIISLIIIAVLALVYFLIISPIVNKKEEYDFEPTVGTEIYLDSKGTLFAVVEESGEKKWLLYDKESNTLTDEEYEYPEGDVSFTQLMFPPIEKENIDNIKVHNPDSDYGFYQDERGDFYMTDYWGTPYDSDSFSNLVIACRYPTVYQRITTAAEDLSVYGLDEESNPTYYEITEKGGRSYKVYIGDLAPTGDLYYARVDGSDAVYVAATDVEYLFRVKEAYVYPYLAMPIDETEYYRTERYILKDKDETIVDIRYLSDSERTELGIENYYAMNYPEGYAVNSTNYDEVLKTFVTFLGTQTVAFVNVSEEMPIELLEEYGVGPESYRYELYFKYDGVENTVIISDIQKETETVIDEKTGEEIEVETGERFYYAYSLHFNSIVKVSTDTFSFLEWDILKYIDRPLLSHLNINNLKSVAISGDGVDELFTMRGEGDEMTVDVKSTGTTLDVEQTLNFRQFYVKLLSLSIEGYSDSRETDDLMMTMVITTKTGDVTEYKFYNTTANHCYFTIDGKGEFYVLKRKITKILEDTVTLAEGGEINTETN